MFLAPEFMCPSEMQEKLMYWFENEEAELKWKQKNDDKRQMKKNR